MSTIILAETSNPRVINIAYEITTGQDHAGQLHGWMNVWDLPDVSDEPPLTWLTESPAARSARHTEPTLPPLPSLQAGTELRQVGMAPLDEMQQLRATSGPTAELLYLRMMIRHHDGAIALARAVVRLGRDPLVVELAREIIFDQTTEVRAMRQLLDSRRR